MSPKPEHYVQHARFEGIDADIRAEQWVNGLPGTHINRDFNWPVIDRVIGVSMLRYAGDDSTEIYYEPWVLVEVETPGEKDE